MERERIVQFLDDLLEVGSIADYGPQGLQVEGKSEVRRVAVGVSASAELFRRAVEARADLIICHHGILWDGEARVIRGGRKERLKLLLDHDITLLAYHLALDAHDQHGNNALLARALGLAGLEPFGEHRGVVLGRKGRFDPPLARAELARRVREAVGVEPLLFPFGPDPVRTLGVVTGGAVEEFRQAVEQRLDAYLTGEAREFVQEMAREEEVTYVGAGHYHTETFGVRSLGERLQQEFGLDCVFLEVPNPV